MFGRLIVIEIIEMDIVSPRKRTPFKKFAKYIMALLGCCAVIYTIIPMEGARAVKQTALSLSQVKFGSLEVELRGYGKLVTANQRVLSSPTSSAVVEIINFKPGDSVKADSVVISLRDPILEQEVEELAFQVQSEKSKISSYEIEALSELRKLELDLSAEKLDREYIEQKLEAERSLYERGIVSKLDFKKTMMESKLVNKRIEMLVERIELLKKTNEQRLKEQNKRVTLALSKMNRIKAKYEKLAVKAEIDGVIQSIDVQLGELVEVGKPMAMVNASDDYLARLSVSQVDARQVSVDQKVTVDVGDKTVQGQVLRIDPKVKEGKVFIDVEFDEETPAQARVDLYVEGRIMIGNLQDIIYVEQPLDIKSYANQFVYVFEPEENILVRTEVETLQKSGNHIVIKKGLREGQQIVISDTSDLLYEQTVPLI